MDRLLAAYQEASRLRRINVQMHNGEIPYRQVIHKFRESIAEHLEDLEPLGLIEYDKMTPEQKAEVAVQFETIATEYWLHFSSKTDTHNAPSQTDTTTEEQDGGDEESFVDMETIEYSGPNPEWHGSPPEWCDSPPEWHGSPPKWCDSPPEWAESVWGTSTEHHPSASTY